MDDDDTPPEESSEPTTPARRAAGDRVDQAEKERRLEEMAQGMAQGLSSSQLDELARTSWGISIRQARRYRREVERRLAGNGATATTEMMMTIYRRALEAKKFSAAASAARDLSKLRPAAPEALELYAKLGKPSLDNLKDVEWICKSLTVAHYEIMTDPSLEPRQRREELRRNARAMVNAIPREQLRKAARTVQNHAKEIETTTREPEIENVPDERGGSLRADPGGRRRGRRQPGK